MSQRDDDKSHGKLPVLTKRNWVSWIAHAQDYIMALPHEDAADIWTAYVWERPAGQGDDDDDEEDPADRDWQAAASAGEKKLRMQHNKAFKTIRDALEQKIFNSTMGMENNVPKLLRFLKEKCFNDNSAEDRNSLREHLDNMKIEDYDDYDDYQGAFDNTLKEVQKFDLDLVDNDERLLYMFNKGLPAAWQPAKDVVTSQNKSFEQAKNFYHTKAKNDSTLPGTLKRLAKTSQSVNFSRQRKEETCRQFALGQCNRGDSCRYSHPATPTQHSTQDRQFRGSCYHCGQKGHRVFECEHKKAGDAARKETRNTSITRVTQEAKHDDEEKCPVSIDAVAYTLVEMVTNTTHGSQKGPRAPVQDNAGLRGTRLGSDGHHWVYMCIDGASTCGVVESEAGCVNVHDTDIWIQTGGEDKPNYVHCSRTGTLPLDNIVDGRRVQMSVPVRIVPGFGTNILPEHYFLKKGFAVNKLGHQLEVLTPDKKAVMRAVSHKYDPRPYWPVPRGGN